MINKEEKGLKYADKPVEEEKAVWQLEFRLELRLMLKGVLRLGSELPLQSIPGVLGVQVGELGSDRPRRSGCGDEPEGILKTTDTDCLLK